MGNPALSFKEILDSILDPEGPLSASPGKTQPQAASAGKKPLDASILKPRLDIKLNVADGRKASKRNPYFKTPRYQAPRQSQPQFQPEDPNITKTEAGLERANLSLQGEMALKVLISLSGLDAPPMLTKSWLKRAYRRGALKCHPDRRMHSPKPSPSEGIDAFNDLHVSLVVLKHELETNKKRSSL